MAPEEGTASCRHRAAREGEPRMGLTARGEPGPHKGDREGCLRAIEARAPPRLLNDQRNTRRTTSPTHPPDPVRSIAAMRPPIFIPARGKTAPDHRTGDIARSGRSTESGGACAAGPAARQTAHGRSADEDMAGPVPPLRLAEQADEMIARRVSIGIGTGVPRTAAAVHFASGYARQADVRAFRTPDRPVAIPDREVCR